MFNKWRKYSYAAQKNQRHFFRWFFVVLAILFVLFNLMTGFICSFRVLESETMLPGFAPGDRLIFSSYGARRLFSRSGGAVPPSLERGHIVLVDTGLGEDRSLPVKTADAFLRFFTAQRVSLDDRKEHFYVKRVIALPGDEISITNFVARVRPAGESYGLTEFEFSLRPYDISIPQVPALWDESVPFSGNMEAIVLGPDECFVLSDDRSNTNDSRTWGPLPLRLIAGRALFRYWPFSKLGRP